MITIKEHISEIFEDEAKTKPVAVRSFMLAGLELPKEKNLPVRVRVSFCRGLYLNCSYQDSDVFLGFPISFRNYLKLKLHRMIH